MKKYILALLSITFIVPSIAFASWWNPFSWKIFQKREVVPQAQVENTQDSEQRIQDLQKQIDELKNKDIPPTQPEVLPEPKVETPKTKTTVSDVCLNIDGIQSSVPYGYSLGYGGICSTITLVDYCPNIAGVQSKVPDGMFIYEENNQCLTQNEINYIAEKMAEEENKVETNYVDPIFSEECEEAQEELDELNDQQVEMNQTN